MRERKIEDTLYMSNYGLHGKLSRMGRHYAAKGTHWRGPRHRIHLICCTRGELLDQWRLSVDDGKVAGEVGLELDCSDAPGQGSLQRDKGRQSTRGG